MLFASASVRDHRAPNTQNITSHLPYLSPPQPLTIKHRCSRPASSVRIDTLTRREPFKQNTGHTRGRGCGRGRGRRRRRERDRARRGSL